MGFFFSRYGPCQTPTLGFCVQRSMQISTFKPEKFWYISPVILKDGYELQLEWDRNRVFDLGVSFMFRIWIYCLLMSLSFLIFQEEPQ